MEPRSPDGDRTAWQEALANARKIVQLERRQGCRDEVVMGGLEAFVGNLLEQLRAHGADPSSLADLSERVAAYGDRSPDARRDALDELDDLLVALASAPPPDSSPSSAAPDGTASGPPSAMSSEAASETASERTAGASSKPDVPPLDSPVRYAKGVGAQRAATLHKLGIETIEDLLLHLPRRLEDRRTIRKVGELRPEEPCTVIGRVRGVEVLTPRKHLEILKAAVQDETGVLTAVWFNQPWLKSQIPQGERIALFGKPERQYGTWQMSNPVWEPEGKDRQTGRLVPIYPATEGITPATLGRLIRTNMARYRDEVRDIVPDGVRERHGLLPRAAALPSIHEPADEAEFERARRSLAFEEFFIFQIGVAHRKANMAQARAAVLAASDATMDRFQATLPFKLTAAQGRVLGEIRRDLASGRPMSRLLQGDVGSGKTVVAAGAAHIASQAGAQTALMAPTEILARQHYANLGPLLAPLGMRVALLLGSMPQREKAEVRELVEAGELDLVVGTHALIGDQVAFDHLGLAVIDEQHRFGVMQRAELETKGETPHVLVMSATPIPRTITLTIYGQFDVSVLDERPHPSDIRTYWIAEDKRDDVYELVATELARGTQGYVVYPLIEESESLDLRSATEMKEELERTHFAGLRVGLLHGRMSADEVQAVMAQIQNGELDVLVSTTIIEVGIDVPDASVLVIEHADRFGLSQLHQLRGRIGRQGQRATCYAVATARTEEAARRLAAFRDTDDGFDIAEEDLKIRGTGELLGFSQHGLDTTFKVADLIRDLPLMQAAREEAEAWLAAYPETPLLAEFERRFGDRFDLARV